MAQQNRDFPEDSELVLCTVSKIYPHCVFVNMEEYGGKQGMIHISEISPGRIRNIHDYVRIGKKVICKVLSINTERGHIDLSLRRVSEAQKREKAEILKKQQKSEKIIEFVAAKIKGKPQELMNEIEKQLGDEYDTLHDFFEEYVADESVIKKIKLPEKTMEALCETIKQRIKPVIVEIEGVISVKTFAPDGVEVVKKIIMEAEKVDPAVNIRYKGAGRYTVSVKQEDFKSAEKIIAKMTASLEKDSKKENVEYSFDRLEKKGKKASA